MVTYVSAMIQQNLDDIEMVVRHSFVQWPGFTLVLRLSDSNATRNNLFAF